MINEYLEKSAKEIVKEFGIHWNLPYAMEKELLKLLSMRDAEILNKIAMLGNDVADTIPPPDSETFVEDDC